MGEWPWSGGAASAAPTAVEAAGAGRPHGRPRGVRPTCVYRGWPARKSSPSVLCPLCGSPEGGPAAGPWGGPWPPCMLCCLPPATAQACGATNHERARLPLRSAGRGPKLTQSSRIAKPASTGDHEPLLAPRAAAPPPSPPRPSRMRALQNGYWAVAPVLATCQPVCSRCHRHPVSKLWGHSGSRGAASWAPPCQRAWLRPFTHISCRVRRTAGCAGWKQSVDGQQIAEGRAMRQECVGVPERGGYRAGRAGRGRWKARMGLRPHTYRARERELRARRASG